MAVDHGLIPLAQCPALADADFTVDSVYEILADHVSHRAVFGGLHPGGGRRRTGDRPAARPGPLRARARLASDDLRPAWPAGGEFAARVPRGSVPVPDDAHDRIAGDITGIATGLPRVGVPGYDGRRWRSRSEPRRREGLATQRPRDRGGGRARVVAAPQLRPADPHPVRRRHPAPVGRRGFRTGSRLDLRLQREDPPSGVRPAAGWHVPPFRGVPHGLRCRRADVRTQRHDGDRRSRARGGPPAWSAATRSSSGATRGITR